jgi:hypothetical protein
MPMHRARISPNLLSSPVFLQSCRENVWGRRELADAADPVPRTITKDLCLCRFNAAVADFATFDFEATGTSSARRRRAQSLRCTINAQSESSLAF